jgi:hypothetical protein
VVRCSTIKSNNDSIQLDHKHLFHSKKICPLLFLTCFIQKIYAPYASSSLLQGKHLPFTPSSLRLNIFRLCMILSLTQLYRYTPEIFLFSTATFKYKYRAPLRRIGRQYSAKVAFSIFQSSYDVDNEMARNIARVKYKW